MLEFGVLCPTVLSLRFVVERVRPRPRVEAGLPEGCPFMTIGLDEPAELVLDPSSMLSGDALPLAFANPGSCCSSASPIQWSHKIHPTTAAKLPQLTIVIGDIRS
jgi:hypothetical protein